MSRYFEWDPAKAETNFRKHRVRFETAEQVFFDMNAVMEQDRIENGEQRWQTIGMVEGDVLILVAHTISEENDDGEDVEIIRIISARRAQRHERRKYESQWL